MPFNRVARGTNTLLGKSFLDQQNGRTNDLGIIVQTHLSGQVPTNGQRRPTHNLQEWRMVT